MVKKILINKEGGQTRVAMLSEGQLINIEMEGAGAHSIKGDIYKARISSINTSLQAAFVDIGQGREGFLSIQDVGEPFIKGGRNGIRIEKIFKQGQELIVQVVKDPIDKKGATLTTAVSIPGRYMVLVPGGDRIGVSKKLPDEQRQRIKELLAGLELPEGFGIIARTAAQVVAKKQELTRDLNQLVQLWTTLKETYDTVKAPSLLLRDSGVEIRYLREYFSAEVGEVWVDHKQLFDEVQQFFGIFMPKALSVVKFYNDYLPLFTRYDVERQIGEMLSRKVPLSSGGSIVIDMTEALVAIDVNSGKVRGKNVEDTALKTNMDAAKEIARQVMLRDLAGLIVVDFIDLERPESNRLVEQEFKAAFKDDKARLSFGKISKFGLLEMSRQKIRQDVYQGTFETCPSCDGTGIVRSVDFLVVEVLRRVREVIARRHPASLTIELPIEAANLLQNRMRATLASWEQEQNVSIHIQASTGLKANEVRFYMDKSEEKKEEAVVVTADIWKDTPLPVDEPTHSHAHGETEQKTARRQDTRTTLDDIRIDNPQPAGATRRSGGTDPELSLPDSSPMQQILSREEEAPASKSGLMKWLGRMLGISEGEGVGSLAQENPVQESNLLAAPWKGEVFQGHFKPDAETPAEPEGRVTVSVETQPDNREVSARSASAVVGGRNRKRTRRPSRAQQPQSGDQQQPQRQPAPAPKAPKAGETKQAAAKPEPKAPAAPQDNARRAPRPEPAPAKPAEQAAPRPAAPAGDSPEPGNEAAPAAPRSRSRSRGTRRRKPAPAPQTES